MELTLVTNFELLIMMQDVRRRLTKYVLNGEVLERKTFVLNQRI